MRIRHHIPFPDGAWSEIEHDDDVSCFVCATSSVWKGPGRWKGGLPRIKKEKPE